MRKLLITIITLIVSVNLSSALEPVRVAILYSSGASTEINVEVIDYSTPTTLNTTSLGTLTANGSGIITFILDGGSPAWNTILPSAINSNVVVNVKIGASQTLYAQYRLDNLIMLQSQTGVGEALPNGGGAFKSASGTINAVTGGDNLDMENNDILNVDSLSGNSSTGILKTNAVIYQKLANSNTAFGDGSLSGNTGDNVTAYGYRAAYNNTGDNVTAIGYYSANGNTGDYVTATGYHSAFENSGNYIMATGEGAASINKGDFVTATGNYSANGNEGNYVTATGYNSAYYNTGDNVTATGYNSAFQNSGDNVTAIGYSAGIGNDLSGQTIFSNSTLPSYADRTAAETAITILNGASAGNTYLYYNQATHTIEAVRL